MTPVPQTDTAGESGLSQVLMNEIMKLQSAVQEERRKAQELAVWLHSKEDTLREMWVRDSLLRKHQERAQRMKEERDSLSKELRKCKDENYSLALSYAKQSEEKSAALMKNRDLLLEVRHSFPFLPDPGRWAEHLVFAKDAPVQHEALSIFSRICLCGPQLSPLGPNFTSCAVNDDQACPHSRLHRNMYPLAHRQDSGPRAQNFEENSWGETCSVFNWGAGNWFGRPELSPWSC